MSTNTDSQAQIEALQAKLVALQEEMTQRTDALKKAEWEKEAILDSQLEHVVYQDLEHRILWANRAACESVNATREDLIGKYCYEIWPQRSERCEDCPVAAAVAAGTMQEVEKTTPDGRSWFIRGYPVRDEDGNIVSGIEITQDITARKKTEERLTQLEQIANRSPVVFFVWRADEHWTVDFVSDNVQQFGYTPEDFYSGRVPYADIVHPDDLARVAAEVEQYSQEADRAEFTQSYRIITQAGETRWTDDRTWIRRDAQGNITHYQGIVLDVTAQKQAETERERLQQEIIEAQREALRELSTPVIPVMDRILVMPLVGSIDSMRAKEIMRTVLQGISEHRAKVIILDVTGVAVMDTGIVNHLNKTIQAARLKGARTIVTGISDAVAEAIVDLGIDWGAVETLRDLQTGLRVALDQMDIHLEKGQS
jgi:rsbT co-antagonist protein RsbR